MKKSFFLRFFIVLLVTFLCSHVVLPTYKAYAGRPGGVSGDEIFPEEEDETPTTNPREDKPGFVEKFLCEFLTAIGGQLENLLDSAGITIDRIIYGRGSGSSTALFTFELKPGNPYGIVGASLYNIFRTISFSAIGVIIFSKLALHGFSKMTPQNLDKARATFSYLLLSFLLLMLTPYLVNTVLDIRDALARTVTSTATSQLIGGGTSLDLIGVLREEAGDRIIGGVVYIAAIIYTLYLAFLYAGYAMCFLVCFASFPLVAIIAAFKQDLLKNWVSTVSYFVLVPVIDGALLLIPVYMVSCGISGIIVLFSCMCMIQARSILAQLLGVHDRGGGMMGFAAMMATAKLAGSAVRAGKTAVATMSGAASDSKMANYEDEMAAASGESLSAQEAGIESASPPHSVSSNSSPTTSESNSYGEASNISRSNAGNAGAEGPVFGSASDTNVAMPAAAVTVSNASNAGAEGPSTVASASSVDGTASGNVRYSDIADKYANIHNFESSPLNGQISHAKKAELYRQRARQRRKQAVGSLAGGALGGLAGASAGLMLGPAVTSAMAGTGINVGSEVGGTVASHIPVMPDELREASTRIGQAGRTVGQAIANLRTTATSYVGSTSPDTVEDIPISNPQDVLSSVEKVDGEVINAAMSRADVAVATPSMDNVTSSTPLVSDFVTQESVNEHLTANVRPIMESCRYLNDYYIDNAQAVMEPIYKEMRANNDFNDMDNATARELFRERIYTQYMNEFEQLYDNHSLRVVSDNALLEQVSKEAISSRIRSGYFNKDNTASFVSDDALNSYSWFDL